MGGRKEAVDAVLLSTVIVLGSPVPVLRSMVAGQLNLETAF